MAPLGSGAGNTRVSASKHWCFTLNNYDGSNIKEFENAEVAKRYVFQEEIGENGTPHLQGYIEFHKKARPFEHFVNKSIHWEKCRNIKQSIQYCQKKDTRNGEVYRKGIKIPYEVNIELYEWERNICSILDKDPDDRSLYWIWEPKGNRGKTTFQKWVYLNYPNTVVLSGKATDMKNGIIEYEKKNGTLPRVILINIPRTSLDYVSYAGIEDIKDMFFYSGKYEGGMVCGASPHVVIFANEEPIRVNCSKDRWQIIKI